MALFGVSGLCGDGEELSLRLVSLRVLVAAHHTTIMASSLDYFSSFPDHMLLYLSILKKFQVQGLCLQSCDRCVRRVVTDKL